MTNTLKAAFEHAALAQAAYMNLSTAANSDLSAVLKRGGMTEFMADYISRRYSVYKSSITGGILNPIGYQGIIFQELNADGTTTDNYVLANRGTEASLSVLYNAPQDLIADIFLAGTGTNPQTLQMQSLYNEIPTTATRITTTGHSLGGYLSKMALVKWKTAPQNSTKKIDFAYTYNGAGINNYLGVPSIGQALRAFVELDPLTITNPRAVNYITTENPEIVPLAGVHPGEIRMVNTDVQPPIGAVLGHGIDNLVNALLVAYVFSHIDSSLDNTAGLQKINAMVEGSHRSTTMDGNGAIAALAKLFGLSASTINNALYESDEKLKESNLQKLAFDILSSTGTNTTTGGHSIVPLVTFAANGQTEYHLDSQNTSSLAYRYALTELNPFVIEGLDYSRFNTNGQLNDYNPDTGQGSLTKEWLKDRAAFLQEVLKLNINNSNATQITRNIARSTHYQDLDKNISLTLLSQSDAGLQSADNTYEPNTQKIIFGRNTSIGDNLSGGDLADSLYGGLGNDTLIGGTDQDLLDGGFGNDILDAGEGNDTLIGGAGNDQLTGNLGDDSLDGGLGDDIFSFSTSQGSDTIQDTQGNNTLVINGQQNFIVKRLNAQDNVYVHQSTGNLFLNTSDGLWILLKDQGGSVRVKGWTQSNNFGITLDNEIATQLNLSSQQSPEYHIDTALLDSIIGSLSEEDKQEFAVSLATGSLRSYLFRENVTVIEPIMASVFQPTQGKGLIYNDIGQGSPQGRIPFMDAIKYANDTPYNPYGFEGADYADQITGFDGAINDVNTGASSHEILNGMAGNDLIMGQRGNDHLVGGKGSDTLIGGEGNDIIKASGFRYVNTGQSWAVGGLTNQELWAQQVFLLEHLGPLVYQSSEPREQVAYAQTYQADTAQDQNVLDGGLGNDTLVGSEAKDIIYGGEDKDTLVGGAGQDVLDGGNNNDDIWGDSSISEVWYGQADLAAVISTGVGGILSRPLAYNLILMINQQDIGQVDINLYNDTIFAGEGNDIVHGEIGHDEIWGDAGDDTINGDRLNSYANYAEQTNFLSQIGETTPTLTIDGTEYLLNQEYKKQYRQAGTLGWHNLDISLHGNDVIHAGLGNDIVWGNSGHDMLFGDEDDDYLIGDDARSTVHNGRSIAIEDTGAIGNDTLWGGAGQDYLEGNKGNDWLDGGDGQDTLWGGIGNDTLAGGEGNDQLDGGWERRSTETDIDTGNDQLMGGAGNDTLYGGQGDDVLEGGNDQDTLYGGAGNDTLDGGNHDDWLYAGDAGASSDRGNNKLSGGAGHDHLFGGQGIDTLIGGAGDDELYGGMGQDVYAFALEDGNDTINDDRGNDRYAFYAQANTVSTAQNSVYFEFGVNDISNVSRVGHDLLLSYGTQSQLRIKSYYYQGIELAQSTNVADFYFADGTVWTSSDILAQAPAPTQWSSAFSNTPYFIRALIEPDASISTKTTFSYRFANSGISQTNFSVLSATQKTAITQALSVFSQATSLTFVQSDQQTADLTFFLDDLSGANLGTAAGYAESNTGNIHLNVNSFAAPDAFNAGTYGFEVLLHEIGHALGLKHPFEAPMLPESENNQQNTLMSYTSNNVNDTQLKIFDIAALHYLYGINPTINTEDNVYYIGQNQPYIVDGAGEDTLNAANQSQGVTLNLNQGGWSFVGQKDASLLNDNQLFVGYGSHIEHAIGGTGNDTLLGNQNNNTLQGAEGNDNLTGGTGDDLLMGGVGTDHYFFAQGDGHDQIIDGDNQSIIHLNDVSLAQIYQDNDTVYYGFENSSITLNQSVVSTWVINGGSYYDAQQFKELTADMYLSSVSFTLQAPFVRGLLQGQENATLTGNNQNNFLIGNSGHNTLDGGIGNDSLLGGLGDDTYVVDSLYDVVIEKTNQGQDAIISSIDYTLSDNVENLTLVANARYGAGNALDNTLIATYQSSFLSGSEGNDKLIGQQGNDTLFGGEGNDTLIGGKGNDLLKGGGGNDTYIFNVGDGLDIIQDEQLQHSQLQINASHDGIVFIQQNDDLTLQFANSTDQIFVANYFQNDGQGTTTLANITTQDGYAYDYQHVKNLVILRGTEQDDDINASTRASHVQALGGNDTVQGSFGNDTLNGGDGDDRLYGQAGNDLLIGGAGNDYLNSGEGNNTLIGGLGGDTYHVYNNQTLVIEDENLEERQGASDPHYYNDTIVSSVDSLVLPEYIEDLRLSEDNVAVTGFGNDAANSIFGNANGNYLYGANGNDVLWGMDGNDTLFGEDGDDVLYGFNDNDTLDGGAGDDSLEGGLGVDSLIGGEGDDSFHADIGESTAIQDVDGAGYIWFSEFSLQHNSTPSVDLFFRNSDGDTWGYSPDDITHFYKDVNITYQAGSQQLNITGLDGQTQLVFTDLDSFSPLGSLKYSLNFSSNWIDTQTNEVIRDQVYQLGELLAQANILNVGSDGADYISSISQTGINTVQAGAGDDTINGGEGNDTLYGEAGNDEVLAGAGNDLLDGGEGNDYLHGMDGDDTLLGGEGNDWLNGGAGDDIFDGGAGFNTLIGGEGSDIYYINSLDNQIIESSSAWWYPDTVISSLNYQLGTGLENLTLLEQNQAVLGIGNSANNVIHGNSNDNLLQGLQGYDQLYGHAGNDTLQGGSDSDDLYGGDGDDLLQGEAGYDSLYGDSGNDVLEGGASDDRLNGESGQDTLIGGTGDDNYYIDDLGDVIVELANQGTDDTVYSEIDYTLQSNPNLEHLTLTDDYFEHGLADNLNGKGNDVANRLQGNAGDNTLYSLSGDDTLDGGGGNDSLYGGEGNDDLKGGADALQLEITGTEWNHQATVLSIRPNDDLLDGGEGDDLLNGGTGNDTLLGGEGNDELYGGDDVDSYSYYLGGEESIDVTLDNPLSNHDYLDGGAGDDTLDGGSGDDTLIGGAGYDYLVGGTGNDILNGWDNGEYDELEGGEGDDIYYIDGVYDGLENIESVFVDTGGNCNLATGDIDYSLSLKTYYAAYDWVWENEDEGYDIVYSRISVSFSGSIEEAYLVGDDDADLVGSDTNNLLQGNNGNNILDGGWGVDTLIGGLGNDVYIIDDSADVIEEAEFSGNDTVLSFVEDYHLGDNLENLYLGTGTLKGAGNDLNNLILGNSGTNTIAAQAGNDRIRAAQGDDTVYGGLGDDTYIYYTGDGNDVIFDEAGQDTLHLSEDIVLSSLVFSLEDNDLVVSFSDAEGSIRLQDWLTSENRIETLQFCGSTEVIRLEDLLEGGGTVRWSVQDDVELLDEDHSNPVLGSIFSNDIFAQNTTLLVSNAGDYNLSYGQLTVNTDGSYQYTLNANAHALSAQDVVVDSIQLTVFEAATPTKTQTSLLSFTVKGLNDAPLVVSDSINLSEDSSLIQGNVLSNDTDPDTGDMLSTTATTLQGQYGTLVLESTGDYTYQVNTAATQSLGLGDNVVDNFETLVTDGSISVASRLAISITGQNDVAVTQTDSGIITVGDAVLTGNVLANDSDVDAGTVLQTLATTIQGQYGVLTLGTDGSYQYQVNANQADVMALGAGASVVDSFSYTATDGITPVSDTLNITVVGRNDAPIVNADVATVTEDTLSVQGNILNNDTDPDTGDVLISTTATTLQGQYGTLVLDSTGHYDYQVNSAATQSLGLGDSVVDSFNTQVSDGSINVASSLAITVTGLNDVAITQADSGSITVGDTALTGNVLSNDSDVDAGTVLQTVATTIQGQYGTLTLDTDGGYQYQVNAEQADVIALGAGASVVDSFNYTATDGITPVSDTLSITVVGRNDAPIVTADVATVSEDTLHVQGNVLSNDTDPDTGDVLNTTATTLQGQYGTLVLDSTGHYDYQVNTTATQSLGLGETAVDSFNTQITDGSISVASNLAITVTGLNDAPTTIGSITTQYASVGQAWHHTLPTLSTLFNDVDANDQLSFSLQQQSGVALPTWLHFDAQTGELSGTPTDQSSRLSLAILAIDKGGLSTQANFNLYINGLNVLGGSQDDTLTGSALNDTLNGGVGSDTLRGGNGDDIYYVDTIASQSCNDGSGKEHGNEGLGNGYDAPPPGHSENQNDGFGSSIGHPSNKSNSHRNKSVKEHGNSPSSSSNCITITGDQVIELANQGYDTVRSTVDYTLSEHVEALTLLGQANLNGAGNSLNNTLIGNSGANILNGLAGQDTLIGLAGNDTYLVDNIGDTTIEAFNEGIDTVQSSITWTLADNLENLTLIGSSAINGTGNALNNMLMGNSAKNTLAGGLGHDTYVVGTGDVAIEAFNEGIDTVQSSVTWILADNLENLTLIGSSAINGTGNALDNVLTGNSAKNTLAGGLGRDTYVVSTGDVITEQANAGVDTVVSDVTWALASNLENLTLIGSSAINGTGNALDNILTGNSAKNTLAGGLGNDTYVMEQGWGTDTLVDYDKTANNRDVVLFGEGISKEELWFSKKGNDLEVSLIGTTDKLVVSNWYKGDAYHTEQFRTADGDVLDHNKVAQLVQAMSSMKSPSSSSGHGNNTLSQSQSQRLDMAIASSWS